MAFEPINTQEELDALIKERIKRAETKAREEFADYDELKNKVAEYEQASGAGSEELAATQARIAELEEAAKQREESDAKSKLRAEVAKTTGIPAELIVGDDEESMTEYAQKVSAFAKVQTPPAPHDPSPGAFPDGVDNDERVDYLRGLLGKTD